MGNNASRMDRHYGNYEKSFERIEKDVQRVKVRCQQYMHRPVLSAGVGAVQVSFNSTCCLLRSSWWQEAAAEQASVCGHQCWWLGLWLLQLPSSTRCGWKSGTERLQPTKPLLMPRHQQGQSFSDASQGVAAGLLSSGACEPRRETLQ